ncbi:MAG TPA: aminotransferase class III-fold pyridoxal phosphate-dependent enzyme [Candidatus Sulfomarinibacteraceae bacterium]|nr:aminotransferase class III-fold pyridoxal phosphate-dependent enzyme [Candidatus Sulfomarinibacteraceae bacterium]
MTNLEPGEPLPPFADWSLNPLLHPSCTVSGTGGRLVDEDGVEWVDWLSGWGRNLLGYGDPEVAEAIARQAAAGCGHGVEHRPGRELQRRIVELVPGAEVVAFGKNGSDVTAGAVRLARAITGRELVLYHGYHGFHDWYVASDPSCPGVPRGLAGTIAPLPFWDLDALGRVLREAPGGVAAAILDPVTAPVPDRHHMLAAMKLVRSAGGLVIFDEVGTGFRLAPGGAQELLDVVPDLSCFSKAIANGMPLSVLSGPVRFMQHLGAIRWGMTFAWEAVSMAAANATLLALVERRVPERLWATGEALQRAYREAAAARGLATELTGAAPRCQIAFADSDGIDAVELRWLVIAELAKRHVLTTGVFLPCAAHDENDIERTAAAFEVALDTASAAVAAGRVDGLVDPALLGSIRASRGAAGAPPGSGEAPIAAAPTPSAGPSRRLRHLVRDLLPHGLVRRIQARRAAP